MKRRGAIELSTSTTVVVVLAILMLVLGIVLVRTIMCNAIRGVGEIDEKVRGQLQDLFTENEKIVVKEKSNEIQRGVNYYGVAFAIRNDDKTSTGFSWNVEAIDTGSCKMTKEQAEKLMTFKKGERVAIPEGGSVDERIVFDIPDSSELCSLRYRISVKHEGIIYGSTDFDVKIVGKKLVSSMC